MTDDDHTGASRVQAQQQALLDLTRRYVGPVQGPELIREILEIAADALAVDRVGVWHFNESRTALVCVALFDRSDGQHTSGTELLESEHGAYFAALSNQQVIAAEDARTDPRTSGFRESYLLPLAITSMLDVPLRTRDRVGGVLCHEHRGAVRAWSSDERFFAMAVANFVALAEEESGRRRAQEALQAAKDAAEAASRTKGEFLANMSHEVRTPLNGVLGMIELSLQTKLDEEQRDYLETARNSAVALISILDDVLDVSKVEAGKLELVNEPFSVRKTLGHALVPLGAQADQGEIELSWTVDDDVPDAVVGDAGRLRQVLVNLVGNALKFTAEGAVTVRVELVSGGLEDMELQLCVEDTGLGIPADRLDAIFEPFVQSEPLIANSGQGTGLGLTICRRLVELMGGRLWVESEQGHGARFFFTIRVGADRGFAAALAQLNDAAPHTPPRARILLAEDNNVNQRVASLILRAGGHSVHVVGDGAEALRVALAEPFDVILMDLQMPVMDGLAVTRALRDSERGGDRRTPVVALTAHAMVGDKERCLAAGMDGYLSKPLRSDELERTLASLLEAGDAAPGSGSKGVAQRSENAR